MTNQKMTPIWGARKSTIDYDNQKTSKKMKLFIQHSGGWYKETLTEEEKAEVLVVLSAHMETLKRYKRELLKTQPLTQ